MGLNSASKWYVHETGGSAICILSVLITPVYQIRVFQNFPRIQNKEDIFDSDSKKLFIIRFW
jgi:hypothetical protein